MKHVNQSRHGSAHGSPPQRRSPGLGWSPALEENSSADEHWELSPMLSHKTASGKNGWHARPAVPPPETESDQTLVAQSRAGGQEAFEQLVLRHKDRVYTLAYRVLGDHGEAEDVTQETFLRAYERLADFRGEARFSTWLYRICHNLCANRFQKKNREVGTDSAPEAGPSGTMGSYDQLVTKERRSLLNWALSHLKVESREVILLYHTDHLSYEEIASVVGHPVGTVRSRLHRGREELKEILRPYFSEA